ncbi:uncharacterized protein [Watersipora subatra]|uniref:uncharacterized protein n=1 Tax=Watersipora subatra TaxID=2589382 RepID=UPI00355B906F
MYYTASDSHCSALWPKIKIDVEHTLYMRIFTENAGNFTPFIKDGRSDTLYYLGNTEYITAKTVARWSNWIRNRVCPPVCNYPLERNRTCIPGVLGPMYDRYESWLLEPNCTVPSRDGSPAIANQLFDTMNYTNCNHFGLNCLNQEDFDEERSSMTAVAVFGGRTINLLAEPTGEYLRSFYHKYEHYNSYVERSSDNWPLPIPNAAVSYKDADYHFNKSDIRNIPRDKFDNFNVDERRTTTSVLTLIKGATGYIEWTIDLDNPAFGANDKIETLRVFKSQRIPEACWKSQRHPCQEFSRTGLWDVDNDAFGIDLSHDPVFHALEDTPLLFGLFLFSEDCGAISVVQDDEIPGFQYPALSQPNRNYFQYTNVFPYTNRDLKTELGVYTLTVQQQNSRLYSINLYWKNLIIPPTDILKVEYLLGCKDLSDKVPVQIESKMRVQGNPESYYENFRPVYYTFELNIEQQGADLFNNMEHRKSPMHGQTIIIVL